MTYRETLKWLADNWNEKWFRHSNVEFLDDDETWTMESKNRPNQYQNAVT